MKILIINAGSSSLKYQFMESEGGEVFAKGLCERIGIDGRLTHKVPGREDVKLDIHGGTGEGRHLQRGRDRRCRPPRPPRRHGFHRQLHH